MKLNTYQVIIFNSGAKIVSIVSGDQVIRRIIRYHMVRMCEIKTGVFKFLQNGRFLITNSVDFVLVGDADSERSHRIKGTNSHKGVFQDRRWRDATDGGSFQYSVKVSTEVPTELVVTYWGGDLGGREFELWVNDRKVGSEVLAANRPGEFYEVRYAMPFELVAGKTDAQGQKVNRVTVKFQARPGQIAGGVYGLRVVAAAKP